MSKLSRRTFVQGTALTATGLTTATAVAGPTRPNEPRYRLGTVTYNIAAAWDVPTLLRVCRAAGLSAVELRTTHKHGVEPSMGAAQRKEVRQRFADAGIEIWGLGTVCEFQAADQKVVQRNIETCREFVQLGSDIGAKGVKVRPNGLPQGVPVERTLEQIGRSLQPCGRAAADAGVEIWVEVHGRGTDEPRHMKTIMEIANHPRVGICWNSNQTEVVNGSVAQSFAMLQPWLKSCHINELHSNYPWRELFRLLKEANYDRVTLAEIPGMPDAASGERLMRYYKALWTELTRG